MTTYKRLVRRTAEIPDVRERVTQLVEGELKYVLHLLHAVIGHERQGLPAVYYHGNGDSPYYDTTIEGLGLLRKIKPPADSVNRSSLLASTVNGRRKHDALERQGYYSASLDSVSM